MPAIKPSVGLLLAVRTDHSWTSEMIRVGEELLGEPGIANHIAMLHHIDAKGTWWALEGRPGGVGWRDATQYLAADTTISNQKQPITGSQAVSAAYWMEKLINAQYDWLAITEDGFRDAHLPVLPDPWGMRDVNGVLKGNVVCSSSAVFSYVKATLSVPPYADQDHIEPSDWVKFWLSNNWT